MREEQLETDHNLKHLLSYHVAVTLIHINQQVLYAETV